jgi:hypothetical protein
MTDGRAINGIAVKVHMGETDQATVYLASSRKCPELLGIIKEISALERKETTKLREVMRLGAKFAEDPNDVAVKDETVETAVAEHEDLMFRRLKLIQDFLVKAMSAAGYADADIDIYLPSFDAMRYQEIAQSIMVGCGRLDFFSVSTQPGASWKSMSPAPAA